MGSPGLWKNLCVGIGINSPQGFLTSMFSLQSPVKHPAEASLERAIPGTQVDPEVTMRSWRPGTSGEAGQTWAVESLKV